MKKQLMALVGVVAVCMLLAVVSNAMAADVNQPKEKSKDSNSLVIGIVNVVKGNDGNIAEIKVTVHRQLIYEVVLDAKGIELGKTMADKRARIEGTIEKKGDVQWLTVKTFSDLRPGRGASPKAKPVQ
jgi:uncharacterized alpha/beta hydrolase family protein